VAFVQRIEECSEHEGCTAIVGELDGEVAWVSHMSDEVHAEHRLNLDYPEAKDHRANRRGRKLRWSLPCDDCVDHEEWPGDHEHRRLLAHHAAERGLGTHAALAKAAGTTSEALKSEAIEKGWAE
jgi:hypothetical protein